MNSAQEVLKDIRGPVGMMPEFWWLWMLSGVLLAALLIMFFWKKISKPKQKPAPAPVPPWEVALGQLMLIERESPQSGDAIKEYYSRLSWIIRVYVEARFDIRAPEMTTEEFMQTAAASPVLSGTHQAFLRDFLKLSDMVKFARMSPLPQDMKDAVSVARKFVTETMPPVASPEKG